MCYVVSVYLQAELVKAFWTPERIQKFLSSEFISRVDRVMDLPQVGEAHQVMESNANAGKILLVVDPSIQ